jgi:hypothetical protein
MASGNPPCQSAHGTQLACEYDFTRGDVVLRMFVSCGVACNVAASIGKTGRVHAKVINIAILISVGAVIGILCMMTGRVLMGRSTVVSDTTHQALNARIYSPIASVKKQCAT